MFISLSICIFICFSFFRSKETQPVPFFVCPSDQGGRVQQLEEKVVVRSNEGGPRGKKKADGQTAGVQQGRPELTQVFNSLFIFLLLLGFVPVKHLMIIQRNGKLFS